MKLLRIVCDIFLGAIIIIALALAAPRLAGIRCFAVTSGSMAPQYPVGCVVYTQKTAPEAVRAGDVITFRLGDSVVATHRVTSVNAEERTFTTKGDANVNEDGRPVSFDSLIGRVIFSLPLLGNLTIWLTPKRLLILLIPLAVLLVLPAGPGRKKTRNAEQNPPASRDA